MATVIGQSGAWNEVIECLMQHGFEANCPRDIENLLFQLRTSYTSSVQRKKIQTAEAVAPIEARISQLRSETGICRSLLNWFRVQKCKNRIAHLRSDEQSHIVSLSYDIDYLKRVLESPELAGARAELDVITGLARLSAEHTVFSDLLLTAPRYIHFNGAFLQSAQIDHIVLGPAGVFVIETKHWSKVFAESGEYHDPFDQIERAAYLCYDLLSRKFGEIRVRSIIAYSGHLPAKPADSYVKVLRIPDVAGYTGWFKQPDLTSDLLQRVGHYLEARVRV